MHSLSDKVYATLKKGAKKRGFVESHVLVRWPEIVPEYAPFARPERLFKGTLTLGVAHDGVKQEILMEQDLLIQRINMFFGYPAVGEIRLINRGFTPEYRQKPLTWQPDAAAVDKAGTKCLKVADADLQAGLKRLGEAVFSK